MDREQSPEYLDLATVLAELEPLLASTSWTRASLEDVKADLEWWIGTFSNPEAPSRDPEKQHDSGEDALDDAIIADRERAGDGRG